jgi:maleylacetate reductase
LYPFTYVAHSARVVFGQGCLSALPVEVAALGAQKALVLCTPHQRDQAERVAALLGPMSAGVHDGAIMHVPIESARQARAHAASVGADCAVAVGGDRPSGWARPSLWTPACRSSPCRPLMPAPK